MRSSLAQHQGQGLMCCGWILHWKDHPESRCRQVTIGKPVFKAPDPLKRFQDLKVIAKEAHVNLFIPYSQLASYDTKFLLNEKIYFYGFVTRYVRSNGSSDYAITSITQNPISHQIEKLRVQLNHARFHPSKETLILIEDVILKMVSDLLQEIDDLGDHLPTFRQSKTEMQSDLIAIHKGALKIQSAMTSRQYRRKCKRKSKSSLGVLVGMYS